MSQEVTIGACRLICGDAYTLLPELVADACIADPPYGIGYDCTRDRSTRRSNRLAHASRKPKTKYGPAWQKNIQGDDRSFNPMPWLRFPQCILWGANHYASALPNSPAWLIWDKRAGGISDDFSDCEIAWTNLGGPARLYHHLWRGACRAGEENPMHGSSLHPMQKPLALMRWCVEKTTGTVLDPFAGLFTTAVACMQLGRPCIAIEIDEEYWGIGCRRVQEAYKQVTLFAPSMLVPAPIQEVLL